MAIIRFMCACFIVLLPVVASQCLSKDDENVFADIRKQLGSLEAKLKKKTAPACPPGWRSYNGHCYFFSKNSKIWTEAESECRGMSSHLVTVNDGKESSWLRLASKGANSKAQWWIGARQVNTKWEWTDLSSLGFKDWAKGEPNSDKENCAHMDKGKKLYWNDHRCTQMFNFICEKEAVSCS